MFHNQCHQGNANQNHDVMLLCMYQSPDNTKCWWRCGTQKLSFPAGRDVKCMSNLEDSLAFSYKRNIFLQNDPAVTLLGIYSMDMKIPTYSETCTWMFGVPLNTMAKLESNQNVLPYVNGKTNKLWYPDNGVQFSMQKK